MYKGRKRVTGIVQNNTQTDKCDDTERNMGTKQRDGTWTHNEENKKEIRDENSKLVHEVIHRNEKKDGEQKKISAIHKITERIWRIQGENVGRNTNDT